MILNLRSEYQSLKISLSGEFELILVQTEIMQYDSKTMRLFSVIRLNKTNNKKMNQ